MSKLKFLLLALVVLGIGKEAVGAVATDPKDISGPDEDGIITVRWAYTGAQGDAMFNSNDVDQEPNGYCTVTSVADESVSFRLEHSQTVIEQSINSLLVDISPLNLKGGEYILDIPEGYLIMDEVGAAWWMPGTKVETPHIYHKFKAPKNDDELRYNENYTVSGIQDGVLGPEKVIILSWTDADQVYFNADKVYGEEPANVQITTPEGETYLLEYDTEVCLNVNNLNSVEISLASFNLQDGSYLLTVPESVVIINEGLWDAENPTIEIAFDVIELGDHSAVQRINTQFEIEQIFDLDGNRIQTSIPDLPTGLYIINGKKVILP